MLNERILELKVLRIQPVDVFWCVINFDRMKSNSDNPVLVKSFNFAIRVVNLYKVLTNERREYVISKQLLRSGTSIGANAKEGSRAQSKADFYSKMSISLKEASESEYWIELLSATDYLTDEESARLLSDCRELIRMLMSITSTTKKSLQR